MAYYVAATHLIWQLEKWFYMAFLSHPLAAMIYQFHHNDNNCTKFLEKKTVNAVEFAELRSIWIIHLFGVTTIEEPTECMSCLIEFFIGRVLFFFVGSVSHNFIYYRNYSDRVECFAELNMLYKIRRLNPT